jgi:preprotein translocase subunit SecG
MPNDGQAFVNTQIIVIVVVVVCLFVLLSVRSPVDFSFDVQESGLLLVYFYLNKDDFYSP